MLPPLLSLYGMIYVTWYILATILITVAKEKNCSSSETVMRIKASAEMVQYTRCYNKPVIEALTELKLLQTR